MNPEQRKILFVSSFTLPETAGSGIHAFRFARYINRYGDKAVILTFNRNLKMKYYEKIDNVPIIRIPYFNRDILLKVLSLPLVTFWYIIQIFKTDITIIYGGKTFAFELAMLFSILFKKKTVFQSLLVDSDDLSTIMDKKNRLYKYLIRKLFTKIDCYFSINQIFTSQYIELFGNDEHVLSLPQGVDVSVFYPQQIIKDKLREKLNLPFQSFLIVSVGFLINRKGYREMFDAIKLLDFECHSLIIGEHKVKQNHFLSKYNTEMDDLYQYGKALLKDRIIFAGFQENPEEFINASDVFFMNSNLEGLPNVLLEAMACGVPVVTKKIEGVDGFLTKHMKNSLVFQNNDEMVYYLKLLHSNDEKSRQIALEARNEVINNYSFEQVYSKLILKINA